MLAAIVTASASAAAQVSPAQAQETADEAIGRLRSPFCPGLMLEVCPTTTAEALRDSVRGMAAQGQGVKQIVEGVLARHGEEWRAVPKRSGAGLLAWLVLPFVLLGGSVVVWTRVRAMRGQGQVYAVGGAGVTDEERARLDAALREFDRVEDEA
ncbi:MAG TPA: cytochrome c-type biogenesis protein CcmH [Longimicrobium sp.]|nr:cytochrome c-type biogenesis protein CcmH [Longimicrobium sp.]